MKFNILKFFCLLLSLIMLVGCGSKTALTPDNNDVIDEILSGKENLFGVYEGLIEGDFLLWVSAQFGEEALEKINSAIKDDSFTAESWYDITGNTALVLRDMYTGALDPESPNYRNDIKVIEGRGDSTVIRVVGDISFADNWKIIPALEERGKGIHGVLSEETVKLLREADIFLANNEFTYSTRGEALKGKMYTFRAEPSRVQHMLDIGADIISLANNHAYDFGEYAFADTLQTLRESNLAYIGGGENIEEASKPFYFIVNGRKYGFSAATKAEKLVLTPEATESTSGVLRTYDPEKYLGVIARAEEQCDYNIAYVHWGAEGSHNIEDGLYEMAGQYIDAGADIVIGAHAHILQGIQYYKGVPIVYNLGNFLFNAETIDTGILEIEIKGNKPTYRFIPAIQKDCYTEIVLGKEANRILEFMESLSVDVKFAENGEFAEKK